MTRNNSYRSVEYAGRSWCHQQAQGLLNAAGARGQVKTECIHGAWFATIHDHQDRKSGLGHGKTLFEAMCNAIERATPVTVPPPAPVEEQEQGIAP